MKTFMCNIRPLGGMCRFYGIRPEHLSIEEGNYQRKPLLSHIHPILIQCDSYGTILVVITDKRIRPDSVTGDQEYRFTIFHINIIPSQKYQSFIASIPFLPPSPFVSYFSFC